MASIIDDVKNALASVISGTGDIISVSQTVARENVIKAFRGAGSVAGSGIGVISEIVTAGIEAIHSTGTSLTEGVLGLVKGAVAGAKDAGISTTEAAGEAASTSIKTSYRVGGDLGEVAVSVVRGAIGAASDIGEDSGTLAKGAVLGVLRAADEIGSETGVIVRKALLNAAALPHDVIDALLTGKKE